MTEISVIIPAYNQSAYIAEAVQSVYYQTFTDWELIIVDDGSTDQTQQVLSGFKDPRVHIVRQANIGVSGARNTGIRLSSAPLVAFLDADDVLLHDQMSILHTYLAEHPEVGLAVGKVQKIDSAGNIIPEKSVKPVSVGIPGLFIENDITLSSVMIRREWLERVRGFDTSLHTCEDWDLWLRLSVAGCRLSRLERVVVKYRIHTMQVTQDVSKMRTGTLGLWEKFFNLPNLPPDMFSYRSLAVASALVRTAARAFRAGEFELGSNDLLEAITLDPNLSHAKYKRLVELLRGWANDPQTRDPEAYLLSISKHVTTSKLPGLSRQLRKAAAAVILEPLFGASQEAWRTQRKALIKAVSYDPSWLANRGVLRMIADAWFPLSPNRAP